MKTIFQQASRFSILALVVSQVIGSVPLAAAPENLNQRSTVKNLKVMPTSGSGMDVTGFQLLGRSAGIAFSPLSLRQTDDDGATWRDITPPFGPRGGRISTARFADLNLGLVFYSRSEAEEAGTEIWRTIDGGKSWNKSEQTLQVNGTSLSVTLLDGQLGWVLAKLPSGSNFSYGHLFHTIDGGQSWLSLPTPPIAGRIMFASSTDGWIVGGPGGNSLFVTHDGGRQWSAQSIPLNRDDASLVEVTLPEPSRPGWVAFGEAAWNRDGSGTIYSIESPVHEGPSRIVSTLIVEATTGAGGARLVAATRDATIFSGKVLIKGPETIETHSGQATQVVVEATGVVVMAETRSGVMWGLVHESGCRSYKADCYQRSALGSYSLATGEYFDITPASPEVTNPDTKANSMRLRTKPDSVIQSTNAGFDQCTVGSVANMQAWYSASPYYDANIYFGGSDRSCSQPLLNSGWVSQVLAQGWRLIPTWVGLQSPTTACGTCAKFSTNASTALLQGINEANSAASAISTLGLATPSILYFDLEIYSTHTTAETQFVTGWVTRLHQLGYDAGLYVHYTNVASYTNLTDPLDGVWIARWYYGSNGSPAPPTTIPSPDSIPGVSNSIFANKRIWQYYGSATQTWGGVTFNIDIDSANGLVTTGGGVVNYTIGLSASPSAGGTVSGGGTFAAGSSQTVTASANSGYSFANWTEAGSVVSSSASYTFTLNTNRTIVANFTTNPVNYTISVSASPSVGGTVSGGGTFASGSSRTVTASVNSGYSFSNWTEGGSVVSSSASYTFTLSSNRTLVANFTSNPVNYTIAVSASPSAGGGVSGGGTFTSGSSRTVTASANGGYSFVNWTESGSVVSSSASYTFTLSSNRTLIANFTSNPGNYTISVSASPSAGGTVGGGGTFAAGSSRTVTATANGGYSFVNWTENGGAVSSSVSYTFTVNADRNLVATFVTGGGGTDLIVDGGFESATSSGFVAPGWAITASPGSNHWLIIKNGPYGHAGVTYGSLGGENLTQYDWLMQTVTIPSNATAANLTAWINITTQEALGDNNVYDVLWVALYDLNGNLITTLRQLSNQDAALSNNALGNYFQAGPFDLSAYKGSSVQVAFVAFTDSTLPTTFLIDDVSLQVSTPTDNPPTTSITTPANGVTVSGTVNVAASASDDVGVTSLEIDIDGLAKAANTNSTSLSYSWNTALVQNGQHQLYSKAYDGAGHVTTSSIVIVTVSNGAALVVTKSGTGSGGIASNPSGIDCGSTCQFNFALNTQVTLTATAAGGSSFSGWSGACSGSSPQCTVTMSQSQNVTAVFNSPPVASAFYVIAPCRIIDTRDSTPLANLATRDVTVAGLCGVPQTAVAVAANITAVAPASGGFLAFYPKDSAWPGNSTLNYRTGKTRANNAILRLSGGKTTVLNNGSMQNFIVDVTGYFQ